MYKKERINTIEIFENSLKSKLRYAIDYQAIMEIIIVTKDRKMVKHYLRKDFKKKKSRKNSVVL